MGTVFEGNARFRPRHAARGDYYDDGREDEWRVPTEPPREGIGDAPSDTGTGLGGTGSDEPPDNSTRINRVIVDIALPILVSILVAILQYFIVPGSARGPFVGWAFAAIIALTATVIFRKNIVVMVAGVWIAALLAGIAGAAWSTVSAKSAAANSRSIRSTPYFLRINVPQPSNRGNPLPTVACAEEVSGVDEIPRGYVVVIANKPQTSPSWHFTVVGSPSGKDYGQVVQFSAPHRPDAGQVFDLVAFAMPASDVSESAKLGNWDRSNLPASGKFYTDEQVKRSPDLTGCNWWRH